jgi:hypothetical protein
MQSQITSGVLKKQFKMQKAGKVTAVMAVMHVFGKTHHNSHSTSADFSVKKAKLGLNLK